MDYLPSTLQLIALVIALSLLIGSLVRRKNKLYPGPRGWPVIGNLLDLRSTQPTLKHPGKAFHDWGQQYGKSQFYPRGITYIIS
jgi:hypothetical protein